MDLLSQKFYSYESQAISPIKSPPSSLFGSSLHSSHTSFPIIAVAIIGILATGFLLVSYYIFVIKCCLNWHRIDLLRRFSFSTRRGVGDPIMVYSPVVENRGLDETTIRSIPIFHFKKGNGKDESERKSFECAVCLNEFQEQEKLRIIPNCGHVFHIDCIDVWLQNNANCPLCRTSISTTSQDNRFPINQIVASNASLQDLIPYTDNFTGRDEDYVVIEIGSQVQSLLNPSLHRIQENLNLDKFLSTSSSPRKLEPKKVKKLSHVSSMGDECIDNRKKDEHFAVQPIRRSFSMNSAADRQLYLAVQEIIQQGSQVNSEVISLNNEGCSSSSSSSSRVKRSIFSFGHGRSSRSAVQPVALEP